MEADEFYTIKEVAQKLKVCENTVRNLLSRKELGAAKVGNQWRISDLDIRAYLATKRQDAVPYTPGHPVRKVIPFSGPNNTEGAIFGDDSDTDDLFA